jgi:hypothetical protein
MLDIFPTLPSIVLQIFILPAAIRFLVFGFIPTMFIYTPFDLSILFNWF